MCIIDRSRPVETRGWDARRWNENHARTVCAHEPSRRPARATTTTATSARATARRRDARARDDRDDARGVDDARAGVGDEDARDGVANASRVLLDIDVFVDVVVVGGVERRRARGIRVARTRRALRTTGGRGDGDSTRGVVAGIRCRKFSLRRVIRARLGRDASTCVWALDFCGQGASWPASDEASRDGSLNGFVYSVDAWRDQVVDSTRTVVRRRGGVYLAGGRAGGVRRDVRGGDGGIVGQGIDFDERYAVLGVRAVGSRVVGV